MKLQSTNFLRLQKRICLSISCRKYHGPSKNQEYTSTPEYPEIPQHKTSHEMEYTKLKNTMKNLKTVEEKQIYLNKPKYYGWYSCVMSPDSIPPASLDFLQYVSNTTIKKNSLPEALENEDFHSKSVILAEKCAESVKKQLLISASKNLQVDDDDCKEIFRDAIDFKGTKKFQEMQGDKILKDLHRFLHVYLAESYEHLRQTHVRYDARVEAFWMRSGFVPDARMLNKRKKLREYQEIKNFPEERRFKEERIMEKMDRCMQIKGTHSIQLRSNMATDSFIDIADPLCQSGEVPASNYQTNYSGFPHYCQTGTNIPGAWTDSPHPFVHLSYVNSVNRRDNLTSETATNDPELREEMLECKALMSGFGLAFSNGCYLGYDPFNDPDRPLTSNVIVSDGQNFKFASYQLNKMELTDANSDEQASIGKLPRNVMWSLAEAPLYKKIDVKSGHVEGFDFHVLANLIKFYMLKPTLTFQDLQGNLGNDKFLHNINNQYNRNYAFKMHRYVFSRRPRRFDKPVIEPWEKMFRINFPVYSQHLGMREHPWYKMAKHDFMGKFHWHPEFRALDYYRPAYQPTKFRPKGKEKAMGFSRVKKVFPPLEEDQS